MRMDRRRKAKLILVFRNFANAPNKNQLRPLFLGIPQLSLINLKFRPIRSRARIPTRETDYYLLQDRPDRTSHPTILQQNEYRSSFPGKKWPGCEVNHSPSSSARVTDEWSYTSPPPHAFLVWTGTTSPFLAL